MSTVWDIRHQLSLFILNQMHNILAIVFHGHSTQWHYAIHTVLHWINTELKSNSSAHKNCRNILLKNSKDLISCIDVTSSCDEQANSVSVSTNSSVMQRSPSFLAVTHIHIHIQYTAVNCDIKYKNSLESLSCWDSDINNYLHHGHGRDIKSVVCVSVRDTSPQKLLNGLTQFWQRSGGLSWTQHLAGWGPTRGAENVIWGRYCVSLTCVVFVFTCLFYRFIRGCCYSNESTVVNWGRLPPIYVQAICEEAYKLQN